MMIGIVYSVVIFLSNMVGAIAGMGGGVIIKPVLDAVGYHPLEAVAFYSSVAVLAMSVSSSIKQVKNGVQIHARQALLLSVGSVLGGIVGDRLFRAALTRMQTQEHVQLIQCVAMIASLAFVLVFLLKDLRGPGQGLRHPFWYLVVGLGLGVFSTFLGIGGGPVNVAVLVLLFGLHIKQAVTYSIVAILFSQLSRLSFMAATTGFARYDNTVLLFIVPAALLGGYVGSRISGRLRESAVKNVYLAVVAGVIVLNIVNIAAILPHMVF